MQIFRSSRDIAYFDILRETIAIRWLNLLCIAPKRPQFPLDILENQEMHLKYNRQCDNHQTKCRVPTDADKLNFPF